MVGDRKNKADKWMPKYVYRGKSSYEYRPDKSTCIKLMKRPKDGIETEQVKAKVWAEYKKANVPTAYKVAVNAHKKTTKITAKTLLRFLVAWNHDI